MDVAIHLRLGTIVLPTSFMDSPLHICFLQIALLGIILCFFYVPKMAVAIAFLRKNAVEAI